MIDERNKESKKKDVFIYYKDSSLYINKIVRKVRLNQNKKTNKLDFHIITLERTGPFI